MMDIRQARHARTALDAHLGHPGELNRFLPPRQGWLRTIREALGMSRAELGQRMGITAASINDIEKSEADRRIKLETLSRTADALNCDVVYTLIPRSRLQVAIEQAARAKVTSHVAAVDRTMELEDQRTSISDHITEEEVRKLIDSGRVWS